MDLGNIDTRELVNSFEYPAMLVDRHHRVLDANTWMARDALDPSGDTCWFSCFELVHGTDAPHQNCPLDDAAQNGCMTVREIEDERNGRLRVWVTPLDAKTDAGEPVFLHVVTPVVRR